MLLLLQMELELCKSLSIIIIISNANVESHLPARLALEESLSRRIPPKENKSVYFVSVFRVRMEDQC